MRTALIKVTLLIDINRIYTDEDTTMYVNKLLSTPWASDWREFLWMTELEVPTFRCTVPNRYRLLHH